MTAEIVKEKLEELRQRFEIGIIHYLVKRTGYQQYKLLQDIDNTLNFPTLKGVYERTEFFISFAPYPEGGFLFRVEMKAFCPFKLELTLEEQETKSLKFKPMGPVPMSEIEIGVKDFDDRYFIETLEEELVRSFLSVKENRDQINILGDFDRLTFQYKYYKLVYYIPEVESLDLDWVFDKIRKLLELKKKMADHFPGMENNC